MAEAFKEFRKDGWPLCPRCEEDELYSCYAMTSHCTDRQLKGETITVEESLRYPFKCYRCNWSDESDLGKLATMVEVINVNCATRTDPETKQTRSINNSV